MIIMAILASILLKIGMAFILYLIIREAVTQGIKNARRTRKKE